MDESSRRNMWLGLTGGVLGVVVLGVILYVGLSAVASSGDGERRQAPTVPGGSDVVAPPPVDPGDPAVPTGDVELDWYGVSSQLGGAQRVLYGGGSFYALSTAPGRNFDWPPEQGLYRSVDGLVWEQVPLDPAMRAMDMAAGSGAVYLIGTAPAAAPDGLDDDVVVSRSTDGGATWVQTALPDDSKPPQGVEVFTWRTAGIAAGARGIVAAVVSSHNMDFYGMLPAEYRDGPFDAQPVEGGLAVIDWSKFEEAERACSDEMAGRDVEEGGAEDLPEPCRFLESGDPTFAQVDFLTWEQLGIDPDFDANSSVVYHSTDGVEFTATAAPFEATGGLDRVLATDDGFLISAYGPFGSQMWWSDDGLEWAELEGLPPLDQFVAMGTGPGGRSAIIGSSRGEPIIAFRTDDGEWIQSDLTGLTPDPGQFGGSWISTGAVGPLGVVALAHAENETGSMDTIIFATDADHVTAIPASSIVASQYGWSDWAAVGERSVVLRYQGQLADRPLNLIITGELLG